MNTLETLKAARERISVPEHWTQGHYARNAAGTMESMTSSKAVCWCAEGSILMVDSGHCGAALRALGSVVGTSHIPTFNDDARRTHAEVLAAFDEAIRRLEISHESLV